MTTSRSGSTPPTGPVGRGSDGAGPPEPIDAGDVGRWLIEVRAAIGGERTSEVPCGTCTACCRSSQFVHIAPDEADTLAHLPRALTFPAPGLPTGHVLLGYDEHGRCPMQVDDACSIYAHRPRTCRTYDCRVFAAAGVEPDGTKVEIGRRVDRWRFTIADDGDRDRLAAVRSAADALVTRADELGDLDLAVPTDPTQLAVLAVEIHPVFLTADDPGVRHHPDPPLESVAAAIRAVRDRDRRPPPARSSRSRRR